MNVATITELRRELQNKTPKEILDICIHLVKYKKENKELLTYLLFEADNELVYIQGIKQDLEIQFSEINNSSSYLVKKSAQKILRFTNKFIKYSKQKRTEVELLIHYCYLLKSCGVSLERSIPLKNLYNRQLNKIQKALDSLHEDLQYDYRKLLEDLE